MNNLPPVLHSHCLMYSDRVKLWPIIRDPVEVDIFPSDLKQLEMWRKLGKSKDLPNANACWSASKAPWLDALLVRMICRRWTLKVVFASWPPLQWIPSQTIKAYAFAGSVLICSLLFPHSSPDYTLPMCIRLLTMVVCTFSVYHYSLRRFVTFPTAYCAAWWQISCDHRWRPVATA